MGTTKSIIEMISDLVRIPSWGGIDPATPILEYLQQWLYAHGLTSIRQLQNSESEEVVGIACNVIGQHPGPCYVLDACVDTAPFGNELNWSFPPTSATVKDGWLYGRGSADSKAAIAIFSHLASALAKDKNFHGTLTLLFDSDEHTGLFRGAKSFFNNPAIRSEVAGVMIGYPGLEKIVTGSRGFLRATVTVPRRGGHSGSLNPSLHKDNAVEKAARLIQGLGEARESVKQAYSDSELPPAITVTSVQGGEG